jgi:hypothetical protein
MAQSNLGAFSVDIPIDYITAIGSIATPILVLMLTAIGWTIRNRLERSRQLEEKLRDDRIGIYNAILEPFILLLTKDEGIPNEKTYRGKTKDQLAIEKIISLEYRQKAFKLSLMGSDHVIRAYNNLMQFSFSHNLQNKSEDFNKEILGLLGSLLLAIRRSVGNEKTSLDKFKMLEWLITDVRKYRS